MNDRLKILKFIFIFRSEKLSGWRTVLAGGTAGLFSWLVAMPADVLKSRLQSGKLEIIQEYTL